MLWVETRFTQLFLVGALLTVSSLSIDGQIRFLSERDFSLAVARFQTSTIGVPHQEITKTEEFVENKLVKTTEITREWDSSENYRVITKRSDGSVTESIRLGSIQYYRVGNGSWSKIDWSKGGVRISGDAPADVSLFSVEERSEGSTKLSVFTEQRIFGEGTAQRIKTTKTFVDVFFWRQRIERTESVITAENVISRSVTTFDYDRGKIDIVAPIK